MGAELKTFGNSYGQVRLLHYDHSPHFEVELELLDTHGHLRDYRKLIAT